MTIGELFFWYSAIIVALLLVFVVLLIRRKAGGKPIFAQADWRFFIRLSERGRTPVRVLAEGIPCRLYRNVSGCDDNAICIALRSSAGRRCLIADGGDACRLIAKVARVATDKKQPLMEGTFSRL